MKNESVRERVSVCLETIINLGLWAKAAKIQGGGKP